MSGLEPSSLTDVDADESGGGRILPTVDKQGCVGMSRRAAPHLSMQPGGAKRNPRLRQILARCPDARTHSPALALVG